MKAPPPGHNATGNQTMTRISQVALFFKNAGVVILFALALLAIGLEVFCLFVSSWTWPIVMFKSLWAALFGAD